MGVLRSPIVLAPMAGGISTPQLVAAVGEAHGFGFLPGGYKTAEAVAADIAALRALTATPFGLNLFMASDSPGDADAIAVYAGALESEAQRYGAAVGEPRFDDDGYEAKLALALDARPAVVSFTFGCPPAQTIDDLHAVGIDVWVTITEPDEAEQAAAAGADALVVQGIESGGHRGYFHERADLPDYGLLALLRLVAARVDCDLVAAGGIADGSAVAAVLCAGAIAAQLGSAFMLTPEAGTSEAQRHELASETQTRLTRAFTGRLARGVVNRFMDEHESAAPVGYPQVHHMTQPIRAAARTQGDAQALNLWAGQAHQLAQALPASAVVALLEQQLSEALARVVGR